MKLVLIGIPGAGKSTQGNLLSHQLNVPYLSTGHIFRMIATEKSPLGRYVKETINTGLLIPDEKTLTIVKEYLTRPEYKSGYILDGFPRTTRQAQEFGNNFDKVIYLEIPDKEALWRLAYRNEAIRSDDTVAAIKRRIEIFHKHTKPVIKYYERKGILAVIDGAKTIKEVNSDILKNLGKTYVANKLHEWKKKKKTLIGLVGLPGSGKTEAAKFFFKKGIPIVQFGEIVDDHIKKHNLSQINSVHKTIRTKLRDTHGMDAFAKLNEKKLTEALAKNTMVIIDGLRSWEEYQYLRKKFKDVSVTLVSIYCDKQTRYRRAAKRIGRGQLTGFDRDVSELSDTNMGTTIALADYLVDNSSSLKDFNYNLEKIYREVYFS